MTHAAPTHTDITLPGNFRMVMLAVAAVIAAFAVGLTVGNGNDPAPAAPAVTTQDPGFGIPGILEDHPALTDRVPGEDDLAN